MALPCQVRKAEIRRARDKLLIWKRGWRDGYKDSAELGDGSAISQPWRILIQECSNPPPRPLPTTSPAGESRYKLGKLNKGSWDEEQEERGLGSSRDRVKVCRAVGTLPLALFLRMESPTGGRGFSNKSWRASGKKKSLRIWHLTFSQ